MKIQLSSKQIWLAKEPVDFRKAIDGLCGIVAEDFHKESIYVFYNKACNKLKILGWHGNGFILLYKRLERGRFTISQRGTDPDEQQLSWLLAGLNWEQMSNFGELKYASFY